MFDYDFSIHPYCQKKEFEHGQLKIRKSQKQRSYFNEQVNTVNHFIFVYSLLCIMITVDLHAELKSGMHHVFFFV